MPETEVLAPRDRASLIAALGRTTEASRLVAGATDWMLGREASGRPPDLLIDLSHLEELRYVRRDGPTIRVGALSTCAQLQRDPVLASEVACLAQAASRVGSVQIRNAATIGGNVANASPCADLVTSLVALDARASVVDALGQVTERPIAQLFAPAGGSALRRDEAILEFAFERPGPERRSAFAKLGVRSSVAVARLNAALVVQLASDGATIRSARLAVGSLAPAAFVADEIATTLEGARIDGGCPGEFTARCITLVDRRIPDRSSRGYKRLAIRGLVADLWDALGAQP